MSNCSEVLEAEKLIKQGEVDSVINNLIDRINNLEREVKDKEKVISSHEDHIFDLEDHIDNLRKTILEISQ